MPVPAFCCFSGAGQPSFLLRPLSLLGAWTRPIPGQAMPPSCCALVIGRKRFPSYTSEEPSARKETRYDEVYAAILDKTQRHS